MGVSNDNGELLLRDMEEISEALCLDRCPSRKLNSRSHLRSHSAGHPSLHYPNSCASARFLHQEFFCHEKKSSIWNWKPFKVLKNLSNRRFNICFFAHVHSIRGLSSSFNNQSVCVRWKKKQALQTCTAKVCKGVAMFNETLVHRCSIYGSRKGPLQSAKYESMYSSLYAYVVQAPGLDIGKHWVDLTKLLPLSFEELEQDKSMAMWTTSFNLAGKAKGAFLNVSFGFLSLSNDSVRFSRSLNVPELMDLSRNKLSVAKMVGQFSAPMKGIDTISSTQSTSLKSPPDFGPCSMAGLSKSRISLYAELDHSDIDTMKEVNLLVEQSESGKSTTISSSESGVVEDFTGCGSDDCEYTVIDKGVEFLAEEHVTCSVESLYGMTRAPLEEDVFVKDVTVPLTETYSNLNEQSHDSNDVALWSDLKCTETQCSKGIIPEELESFHDMSCVKSAETDHATDMFIMLQMENCMKVAKNFQLVEMDGRCEADDDTDVEETEFLNLLGLEKCVNDPRSETDPESPRELLLKEFEKDVLASRNCVFNLVEWGEEPGPSTQSGFQGTTIPGSSSNLDFSFSNGTSEGHTNVTKSLKLRRNISVLEDLDSKTIRQYPDLRQGNLQLWRLGSSSGFGSPICVSPVEISEPSQLGCLDQFMQAVHGELASSTTPSLSKHATTSAILIIHPSTRIVVPSDIGAGVTEILFCLASVGMENLFSWLKKIMPLDDTENESMQACPTITVPSRHTQPGSQIEECVENFRTASHDNAYIKIDGNTSLHCTAPDDNTFCATSLEDLVNLAVASIGVLLLNGLLIQHGMSSENAPSCIFVCSRKGTVCPMNTCSNHSACAFEGAKQMEHERENAAELLNMSMSMDEWVKLYSGNAFCGEQSNTQASKVQNAKDFESRNTTVPGNLIVVSMTVQLKDPSKNYKCIGAPMLVIIEAENIKESIAYFKLVGLHICGLKPEPGMKPSWGSVAEWEAGRDWLVANAMGQIEKSAMEIACYASEERITTFWSISYIIEAGLHGLRAGLYVRNSDLIIMH